MKITAKVIGVNINTLRWELIFEHTIEYTPQTPQSSVYLAYQEGSLTVLEYGHGIPNSVLYTGLVEIPPHVIKTEAYCVDEKGDLI